MKKVFLDANVILEILLSRTKSKSAVALLHNESLKFHYSALTVHIIYYYAKRYSIDYDIVDKFLDLAICLPITTEMIDLAKKRLGDGDFEDCLQSICAEKSGCQEIITIDKRFKIDSHTNLEVSVL